MMDENRDIAKIGGEVRLLADGAPTMILRHLDRERDFECALEIFRKGSDYLEFEKGIAATPATAVEFFDGCPPTHSRDAKLCLGIFDASGAGIGVVDLLRGYPQSTDWYIGLLMFVPSARGKGLGRRVIDEIKKTALASGATRILVCALEENVKGRAFWTSVGFSNLRAIPPMALGEKVHARIEMACRPA